MAVNLSDSFEGGMFSSFCIVCDREIIPPKEAEVKVVKKKAAGTIRVKNPDGTVTTRTANGAKTTRPVLRRGPSSQNRLAVAAANNNASAKLQPLSRPTDSPSPDHQPTEPAPFVSTIYCSRACAKVEESRSSDIARRLSYDMHGAPRVEIYTGGSMGSPYAPPSPLYIGDSDTSSNPDQAGLSTTGPACSAPKAIEFFRISREGPDEAWKDVERQRRSSVHPSIRPVVEMSRTASHQSSNVFSGQPSTDSLASLWQDGELYLARSTSGKGEMRMTPLGTAERDYFARSSARRSVSSGSNSEKHIPIPTSGSRPIARSNLSQTSLARSPPSDVDLPPEFGSAPNHTFNLWNSYHSAFPIRDASGASINTHRGFVFPGSSVGSITTPPLGSRRDSGTSSTGLVRPGGTIRAKSRSDITWDSFGRDEVNAKKSRECRIHGQVTDSACTPKQSLERTGSGWSMAYREENSLCRGETIRSKPRACSGKSSSSDEETHSGALAIPSAGKSLGRTPTRPNSAIPDLNALRLGQSCASASTLDAGRSVPKGSFNWDDFEKKGGKVYEVPKALKVNTQKGLFFFK